MCPNVRTPPELRETPVGFHVVGGVTASPTDVIPLDKTREMSNQIPPQLSPASLFEDQAKLDAMRLQVYNRILGTVHQKIKSHSTLPNSSQMISFDIPEWQPGCPRFDVKDCILYIVWNLRHSGFKVLYVSPNRLLISWKEQSIQYYQEESPIRQAMLATASAVSAAPSSSSSSSSNKHDSKSDKKKTTNYRPTPEGVAGMLAGGSSAAARRGGEGKTVTFI
jgi:hypothetical protein